MHGANMKITTAVVIKTVLSYEIRCTFQPMRPLSGETVTKIIPSFVLLETVSRDDGPTGCNIWRDFVNRVIFFL